ncbi:MAG: hypothetical protein ACTSVY_01090 [Candidatus Helarchaeota archaeon]
MVKEFDIPIYLEEENCAMVEYQDVLKISAEKNKYNEIFILV